jgi:hypothetical protein
VPLKPNEAVIIFSNETKGDKDLWTIDSTSCTSTGQHIHAALGQSARIKISRSDTTTLLLKRDVCAFRVLGSCWAGGRSDPVAIFSEPTFWSLVGGRVMKIVWFFSAGD